jgi:biopolymer transport protein ExbB
MSAHTLRLPLLAGLLLLAAGALRAQTNATTVEQAALSLQRDLDAAMREFAALRESIATEKIPLTRELSRLEDRLAEARRAYDQSRRAADTRSLDLNKLKADVKLRQEEAGYVANLLDEYARTFEGRIHPGELARHQDVLQAALQAPQNKDLTPAQRFERQFALVQTSAARLEGLIGGARFDGEAIGPDGIVGQGRFAFIGPIAIFSSKDGLLSGLALPQPGSSKPVVTPLQEKGVSVQLAGIVSTGQGQLPLDPTLGNALKALIAKGNLWGYFKKGGPIMWPLLIVSILAVSVIFERLAFLGLERGRRQPKVVDEIMAALERRNVDEAVAAGLHSRDFVARCLTYALHHRGKSLSDALMRATNQEMVRYTRGISLLDTIVTMAPLLGLLGTVTGMIAAFGMLGGSELSAPTAITGGIAEALIATTFGLGIAVTALVPLNYLHAKCEGARHEMEDATTHLELLMKPIMEAEVAASRATTASGS